MNLLFLCVANSARSQMAEGLARKMFGPDVGVASAGSTPTQVNPFAIRALQEVGIDPSPQYSKSVEDLSPAFLVKLDYVIFLCTEEVCPTFVSKAQKIRWPLTDPAGRAESEEESLERFRQTRDLIANQLREFARERNLEFKN